MDLWQVGGSPAGLAGVIAGIRMHSTLPLLVAALAGAPVAAAAFNTFHFFVVSRPDLRPRRRFVSRHAISPIVTFGTLFFVLQLVPADTLSANTTTISPPPAPSPRTSHSTITRTHVRSSFVLFLTPSYPSSSHLRPPYTLLQPSPSYSLISFIKCSSAKLLPLFKVEPPLPDSQSDLISFVLG